MSGNTRFAGAAIALACLAPLVAFSQDGALERAARAMGATELKSLRYSGDGTGYTFGQAYKPGLAWLRIKLLGVTRTVNYETGSMRDGIVLSRAEALGGGGYPHTGQQRNDQYVSGSHAWNQLATAPLPGPRFLADRVHQMWITPHGALKAALRNKTMARTQPGQGSTAFSFTEPGRFTATLYLDGASLVERVESRAPDPVLGDATTITTYSDYRDFFGGTKFSMCIRQTQGGFPVLDLTVREVHPNAPADIQVPELVRAASERVTADKVADGVSLLGGGSHNSVGIEMKDHLVLVEAPLNEGRTGPVIEQARQLAPGKPIRNVIKNLERLNLSIDRTVPLHGRVVPVHELYTAAGATPR